MFKCYDCGYVFEEPKTYEEDLTPGGVFENGCFIHRYTGCPQCGGNYGKIVECEYCGEYEFENNGEYKDLGFCCQYCLEEENED